MTTLNRPNTVLLVIDVQVGVVAEAFERDAKVSNMVAAIDKARAAKVPVIWVQHSDSGLIYGSEDWQLAPEMKPAVGEELVHKNFRSAFVETNLEELLQNANAGHIVVCGAETNNCVRHTCHTALEMGYDITLVEDAHTTTSFEWNGYIVDAARVIDDQNTNFIDYKLPGREAKIVPVAKLQF